MHTSIAYLNTNTRETPHFNIIITVRIYFTFISVTTYSCYLDGQETRLLVMKNSTYITFSSKVSIIKALQEVSFIVTTFNLLTFKFMKQR